MNKSIVQIQNPVTGKWVKIDTETGMIISHKKTEGPYKNIPVRSKRGKNASGIQ